MQPGEVISPEFPFESKFTQVHGSRMHYIDEGSGEPILFLHGNPTSSYLWRNIIPHLTGQGRCIAPDLIGMGKSDKPPLSYRFQDHVRYLEGFIDEMKLENITLVVHDWGSGLGFHYASRRESNVKGIAFMEALVKPFDWDDFPKEFRTGFRMMRAPLIGWLMVSVANMFVKKVLPMSVIRDLTEEEMGVYRAPYPTVSSRRPVRQWPREIPIGGKPADMQEIVSKYSEWLKASGVPKLLFHAEPGAIVNAATLDWCRENIANLKTVDIGTGIHYLQEDHPHVIGRELARWYTSL